MNTYTNMVMSKKVRVLLIGMYLLISGGLVMSQNTISDTLYMIRVDYGVVNKPFDMGLIAIESIEGENIMTLCDRVHIKVPPFGYVDYLGDSSDAYYAIIRNYDKVFKNCQTYSASLDCNSKIRISVTRALCDLRNANDSGNWIKSDSISTLFDRNCKHKSEAYFFTNIGERIKLTKKEKKIIKDSFKDFVREISN